MAKMGMKILVVLLLLLGAAALVLGVLLFQQRETLKGRTQKLEAAIHQIAAVVEKDEDNPAIKISIPSDQLKTFKASPGGPATMDAPLNQLVNGAQHQLIRLNQTRTDLAETKFNLSNTVSALVATSNELTGARATIKEQEGTIDARNATISEKEVAINNLEREQRELRANNESLQAKNTELEFKNRDLMDTNAVLISKIQEISKMVSPESRKSAIPKGRLGALAYVNADWNFVIVRLNEDSAKLILPPQELLIHRADQLVGKVRVETVVDNLAVAEIINDWQKLPMAAGDYVIH